MGIRSAFGGKNWTDMLSVHFADNRPRAGASDPRHGLHDLVLLGVECLVHGKPIVDVHIDDAVAAGTDNAVRLACRQQMHGLIAHARGHDAVFRRRGAAALDVPKNRDARVKPSSS